MSGSDESDVLSVESQSVVEPPLRDPYVSCPHARKIIERLLGKIEIQPYQEGMILGAKNAEEHTARRKEELRGELIRQFERAEAQAIARATRYGFCRKTLRREFPHTPLPRSL